MWAKNNLSTFCPASQNVWFEPTDVFLATKPFVCKHVPFPTFISPNYQEFLKIFEVFYPEIKKDDHIDDSDPVEECIEKGYLLGKYIDNIIITLGEKGVVVIRKGGASDPFFTGSELAKYQPADGPLSHRVYKPRALDKEEIVNVSGAGDCFASGFIAAMLKGKSEECCVESGFEYSAASLKYSGTVPPLICNEATR